ncbi:DUF4012 domain-containing protein, partial [Patescibacteria group bacterium]|nr:DUF4012 domain-containing protein [Patescibacteria group bacterium]
GGFIGSYGIAEFDEGKMQEIYFDDIYNPDGQMLEKITPPYPIIMMTKYWGMRDSNWSPDFAISADQAVRMYEKEGGYTVDGVIGFTPEVVVRFLELTGPVEMEEYGVVLDSENFTEAVQKKIELDKSGDESSPKKILSDLLPILIDRMQSLSEEQKKQFWQIILDLLNEKHVMFFSYEQQVQDMIEKIGWAGEMKDVDKGVDYLSMIHANIGGRKSDLFMKEAVRHEVNITKNGEVVEDIEITRRNIEGLTWPNYTNYDYLRVYVPLGSELLSVDGFADPEGIVIGKDGVLEYDESFGEAGLGNTKVYEENGKTVFANWIVTYPYDASTVKYTYKLPFKVGDKYNLYVQKQSGRLDLDYMFKMDKKNVISDSNVDFVIEDDWYAYKSNLAKDETIEIVM